MLNQINLKEYNLFRKKNPQKYEFLGIRYIIRINGLTLVSFLA
jgi:hypothetical protein